MNKILVGMTLLTVLVVGILLVFKDPITNFVYETLTEDMFVSEDTDSFDPGSAIGETFPTIDALYNNEKITSLNDLAGEKGTIFVVSRSIDWCPYCMKQMAELNNNLTKFEEEGFAIIGLTYDKPEKQQPFISQFSIKYPILSDNNATSVSALGLLNEEYLPGDEAYGVGYPGAFIIDTNGKVVGKVFIEAYSIRMDADSLLRYAKTVL